MTARALRMFLCLLVALGCARSLGAQPLGTYSWQLAPYCNVVVLAATQIGSQYRLEGYDDQCGANPRAAVTGLVVPNPDGTLEFGLAIVTATAALPVHVDVTFSIATLGGTWRDSAGAAGTFVFSPPLPAAGPPRPAPALTIPDGAVTGPKIAAGAVDASHLQAGAVTGAKIASSAVDTPQLADGAVTGPKIPGGAVNAGHIADGTIGAADVNPAFLQLRVNGSCGAGKYVQSVNPDGTVVCGDDASGAGTITGVTAGAGLSGGGPSGPVTLSVDFAADGSAVTAARGNHTHTFLTSNTAVGSQAASPAILTGGGFNTAMGFQAMQNTAGGSANTAVGGQAFRTNVNGSSNTAIGAGALFANTASSNTAVGASALVANIGGAFNTAVGSGALDSNTSGGSNVAVGANALGANLGASNNIAVGFNAMAATTSGTKNVVIGANAMDLNPNGGNNVVVGADALTTITDGSDNVAIGQAALRELGAGSGNTAVGHQALRESITAQANVAVGSNALLLNEDGQSNTAIGSGALIANVSGDYNVALGHNAGSGAKGSDNILIGMNAGSALSTNGFGNNIMIGTAGADVFNSIRIGDGTHSSTYIGGIYNQTPASGIAVFINSSGKLGSPSSARRFKEEIEPLGDVRAAGPGAAAGHLRLQAGVRRWAAGEAVRADCRGGRGGDARPGRAQQRRPARYRALPLPAAAAAGRGAAAGARARGAGPPADGAGRRDRRAGRGAGGDARVARETVASLGLGGNTAGACASQSSTPRAEELQMTARALRWSLCVLAVLSFARPVAAQPLGTYVWQLTPYCNVLVLAATQLGSQYRLEGFDDQCGIGPRAAVTGFVVPNLDGTLEFGLTVVTATSALPAHIDVTFSIPTLGGPWRDSMGASGMLVFNPVLPAAGSPRPIPVPMTDSARLVDGSVTAADVNPAFVQLRVNGACGAGQYMQSVNPDGSVVCAPDASGAGTITGITPGVGLGGGGTSGTVSLNVDFGGSGGAATVARSDHTHEAGGGGTNTSAGSQAFPGAGGFNTAMGFQAMQNTTGVSNTAFGAQALRANTTGVGNTALGSGALGLATASSNTAVGWAAMVATTTGAGNTAVGAQALDANTAGTSNVAVGANALGANVTASNNTAVGANALLANTGASNTAVGANALDANTSGTSNVAVGAEALGANSIGAANVAVGTGALQANFAAHNVAVGFGALNANLTGTLNTALGYRAMAENTTSPRNVAIGSHALELNNQSDNVAVGYSALALHTSGFGNVAVGSDAMASDTVSNSNTAIGADALKALTFGNGNTAVGYNALASSPSAASNTAVGYFALANAASGVGNVAVGYGALIVATGDNNVAIGFNAGNSLTSGNNNVYIDHGGAGAESNTLRIGSGQSAAYMSGIHNQTASSGTDVFINASGKLGTMTSSRRFKEGIASLGDVGPQVQALRPVTFHYKPEFDDGGRVKQYGLIAEEVDEVLPDLVVRDAEGRIQTVRYHFLPTLLLAEVQRLERERVAMRRTHEDELAALRAEIAELRTLISRQD